MEVVEPIFWLPGAVSVPPEAIRIVVDTTSVPVADPKVSRPATLMAPEVLRFPVPTPPEANTSLHVMSPLALQELAATVVAITSWQYMSPPDE